MPPKLRFTPILTLSRPLHTRHISTPPSPPPKPSTTARTSIARALQALATSTSPPNSSSPPSPSSPSQTTPLRPRTSLTAVLSAIATTSLPPTDMDSHQDPKSVDPEELTKLQSRFSQGDTYAPHDLSHHAQRQRFTSGRAPPSFDAADVAGVDFVAEYKNFMMLSEYVSDLGRIRHSRETGLRMVNQRRLGRALRRAVALGFMPRNHRHPEFLVSLEERRRRMGMGGGGL